MAPPNNQRKPERTPSKSSPASKKLKGSDEHGDNDKQRDDMTGQQGQINMAASMGAGATVDHTSTRRSLVNDPSFALQPPQWFMNFEMRLEERFGRFENLLTMVQDHEHKISSLDFELNTVKANVDKLVKENETLYMKLDDLENRSRRNNLVFYGVPEVDDAYKCDAVVKQLFDFAGISQQTFDQDVARCHRTPTFKPRDHDPATKPRMIHVGFTNFLAREKVRRAMLEKLKANNKFKGSKIFVADDLSKRVLQMRKKKMPLFMKLKEDKKKPFFSYPDKLKYKDLNGKIVEVEDKSP